MSDLPVQPLPPKVLPVVVANVPQVLRDRAQWVVWELMWKDGKWTKVPVNARSGWLAKTNDRSTWSSFDEAVAAYEANRTRYVGIGFVFTREDGYTGLDLDGCVDSEGAIVPAAQGIIDSLASYAEMWPRGGGVKIVILGAKPAWAKCRCKAVDGFKEIEIYSHGRFFAITGHHLAGTPPSVEERPEQLHALCTQLWPDAQQVPASSTAAAHSGDGLSDDELIDKARAAKNGAKFERLWNGDISDYDGDDSRADLALCSILAFWARGDAAQIDRLFRRSKLYRQKWERQDYRDQTIQKGIELCKVSYATTSRGRSVRRKKQAPPPRFEGPIGVVLVAVSARGTPSKHLAVFKVHVDGKPTGVDWHVSTTRTALQKALDDLIEIVARAKRPAELEDEQSDDLRHWVRTVITCEELEKLSNVFAADRVRETANADRKTVFEIAVPHLRQWLGLAFVGPDGRIWSERYGRYIDRNELLNGIDVKLLALIAKASNYAAPTADDPTKPIRHLHYELKVCWTEFVNELPDEQHAELGPASKAASALRLQILQIWHQPETWIKTEGSERGSTHAERMSLGSRARALAHAECGGASTPWKRALRGINAYYRVEQTVDRKRSIWLGMRWDLCRGQIGRIDIKAVNSQGELTKLMLRYGLACPDQLKERVRDGVEGQQRLSVLSREMCDQIIDCIDPEADTDCQPTIGRVTHEGAFPVTPPAPSDRTCSTRGGLSNAV